MADTPLSTRAPESDLQEGFEDQPLATSEETSYSNNAPVTDRSSSQALSDHCTTDRPLSTTEPPSGSISSWSNVDVYISKPSDYPTSPARLLLLLPTGAGIHSRNNQHQADLFARQGYLTVMPDLFDKDPAPNSKPSETEDDPANVSWLDTFKLKAAETAKSFMLDMWLARHTPEKVVPIIHTVLKQAREEFADAVANGNGIYAVGYCFGGKYVFSLASDTTTSTAGQESTAEEGNIRSGPQIKCGTCAHGTLVSMDDVKHLKVPVQIVAVEEDPLFPDEVLDAARHALKETGMEHEIEVYPGVPHGFAVAGDYESKTIIEAQGRAFNNMVRWLNAH